MITFKFKQDYTFAERCAIFEKMQRRFSQRVPIILEKGPNGPPGNINRKLALPAAYTIRDLNLFIRQRIELPSEVAMYFFVKNTLPIPSMTIGELQQLYRDEDNFLYIAYCLEDVYGYAKGNNQNENVNETDDLILIPSDRTVVRYTNESLIVLCRSVAADVNVQWKSPKGELITEHKGRIHIEPSSTADELKLVFMHISLADKGEWSCENGAADGTGKAGKTFNLIVYQKITFTENTTILTVKEDTNATILCEVKGEPQPNVTWHYNGQPITVDTNSSKFRILADGLLINTVTQNDTGEYTCRAYQVNSIASDMQERTVLLKIEHKPIWTYEDSLKEKYAFINGTALLKCEAIAEPPANFTWYRNNKRVHNDKHYNIEAANYISILHVRVDSEDVFSTYKCKVKNHLGTIERAIALRKGEKPPAPASLQLRGFNSNTFDIVVNHARTTTTDPLMKVTGYRIEYMTELEFKKDLGKWTNTKRKDFAYEEGATFLINNLEANTTYLVRAASRNVAGYSDWTKVEKLRTLGLPLATHAIAAAPSTPTHYSTAAFCYWFMAVALMTLLQPLQYFSISSSSSSSSSQHFG